MKKIDVASLPARSGSRYPAPFDEPCRDKTRQSLTRRAGLTQFGANLLTLAPGAWSSQRHWHTREDEFVWVLEGEVVLVTDAGEETLAAGDCAAFRAGDGDGHHLINRSDRPARVLEVGGQMRRTSPTIRRSTWSPRATTTTSIVTDGRIPNRVSAGLTLGSLALSFRPRVGHAPASKSPAERSKRCTRHTVDTVTKKP